MLKKFFLVLAFCLSLPAMSQIIIDTQGGGKVRGKTLDDYQRELPPTGRAEKDSLIWLNHLRRAFDAVQVDSFAVAEKEFRSALRLRPTAAGAEVVQTNLCAVLLAQGKWRETVDEASKALKRLPGLVDVRFHRASANLELQHAEEVCSDAEALLLNPSLEKPAQVRAHLLHGGARSLQRRFAEALSDFDAAHRLDEANVQPVTLAAATLSRMNRTQDAIDRLTTFLALHPDIPEALVARADLLLSQKRLVDARDDADRLVQLRPDDASLHILRAEVLIEQDEKAAARRELDEAVRLGATRGEVHALYRLTADK